jgi:hypothetical protein
MPKQATQPGCELVQAHLVLIKENIMLAPLLAALAQLVLQIIGA